MEFRQEAISLALMFVAGLLGGALGVMFSLGACS
jgi:hypothetical protein